jgi:hypothetical protein
LFEQTWLPGDDLFDQFAFKTPLPIFGPGYNAALPRVNALLHPFLKVTMKEIDQVVLPQGTFNFPSVGDVTLGPTRVWAYESRDAFRNTLLGPAHWPGVTVEAQRFFPTTMTYVNELPSFGDTITINGSSTTAPSGLQYKVLAEGSGKTPKETDNVTVNYRGTLIDGAEFDSSYKRGQPATFQVNGVIKGWTEALQLMKEGSKWQLFIPPELAYGERGTDSRIPPNSTLIFEVELISVNQ